MPEREPDWDTEPATVTRTGLIQGGRTMPGSIEIDRSGFEPLIRVVHEPHWYTVDQLRQYAAYLGTVADEAIKTNNPQVTRPWPYDGPEGRARLTGSLDTGGSFTGDDDDDDYCRQSTTACCPRQTIPDSCSCPDGCSCLCRDCDCGTDCDCCRDEADDD